jgi:hypothetical protein
MIGDLKLEIPEREERRTLMSSCPYGAAVCTDLERRQWGECLECWSGVLERANAVSAWIGAPQDSHLATANGKDGTRLLTSSPTGIRDGRDGR